MIQKTNLANQVLVLAMVLQLYFTHHKLTFIGVLLVAASTYVKRCNLALTQDQYMVNILVSNNTIPVQDMQENRLK
jgi:uncharacterized membrane protein